MPQMSPCSWISLILISNTLITLTKMNLFFEKKL